MGVAVMPAIAEAVGLEPIANEGALVVEQADMSAVTAASVTAVPQRRQVDPRTRAMG